MQTHHTESPNTPAPLNRENHLLIGDSHSCEPTLHETIAQTLTRGETVLFIAADRPVAVAFQQYRDYLDHIRVRTLSELDVEIAPTNKPFVAFNEWDVIFAPPSYLHRQLITRTDWVRQSVLSDIGLLIIDGLDGCDAGLRAILELGVVRFGVHPLDGIVRQVVVTMRSVQGTAEVTQFANWLRVTTETDALLSNDPGHYTWTPEPLREVILTLLASQDGASFDNLCRIIQWGFPETVTALDKSLLELWQAEVVYADVRSGEGTIYCLTALGRTMAHHRLSLTDATYLHTTLLTAQLSWFDLLLVASSTPDFPVLDCTTARDEKRPVLTTPTTVGSTLLQQSMPEMLARLQTTLERLQTSVQVALAGYYLIRGWPLAKIAAHVHLDEASLAVAVLALQRRVAAMRTVTAGTGGCSSQSIQVLWHLLTGIPQTMRGLAALPNVRHWVLMRLRQAGITTLTDLIAADPLRLTVHINPGLFGLLQAQAHDLLIAYDHDETAYLTTFTTGFPPIPEATPLLSLHIDRRVAIDQPVANS